MSLQEDARAKYAAIVARVERFHTSAAEALGPTLTCHRGCSGCCQREIAVFAIEAEVIAPRVAALTAAPHETACPLLGPDGACRIYEVRPLICRTHGLPIRFRTAEGEGRDVCPINEEAGLNPWSAPDSALLNIDVLNAQLALLNRAVGGDGTRTPVGTWLRHQRPKPP